MTLPTRRRHYICTQKGPENEPSLRLERFPALFRVMAQRADCLWNMKALRHRRRGGAGQQWHFGAAKAPLLGHKRAATVRQKRRRRQARVALMRTPDPQNASGTWRGALKTATDNSKTRIRIVKEFYSPAQYSPRIDAMHYNAQPTRRSYGPRPYRRQPRTCHCGNTSAPVRQHSGHIWLQTVS